MNENFEEEMNENYDEEIRQHMALELAQMIIEQKDIDEETAASLLRALRDPEFVEEFLNSISSCDGEEAEEQTVSDSDGSEAFSYIEEEADEEIDEDVLQFLKTNIAMAKGIDISEVKEFGSADKLIEVEANRNDYLILYEPNNKAYLISKFNDNGGLNLLKACANAHEALILFGVLVA